jgi:hypothetical protein
MKRNTDPHGGFYQASIASGRRWQTTFSTQRFLLTIILVVAGICLLTWFLYRVKGGG